MSMFNLRRLRFLLYFALSSTLMLSTSCEKDDDNDADNEQELITTVILTFTSTGGSVSFSAKDLDGDGGSAPVVENIELNPNTDYVLTVAFLDESKTPVENITEEVEEESNEHLVCFSVSGTALPAPTIQDKDDNNKPLGLVSAFKSGASSATGKLKVFLKHEPDKNAANACTTGETDVEQEFNVTIK